MVKYFTTVAWQDAMKEIYSEILGPLSPATRTQCGAAAVWPDVEVKKVTQMFPKVTQNIQNSFYINWSRYF